MNQFYLLLFACLPTMLQSMNQTPPPPISAPKQVERKHSRDSKSFEFKPTVEIGSKESAFNRLTIEKPHLLFSKKTSFELGAEKMRRSDSVITQVSHSPRQDSDDEIELAQPKTLIISAIADGAKSTSPDAASEDI